MKLYKTFLLVLFAYSFSLNAQNFFPLKLGNAYQYYIKYYYEGPGGTGGSGERFGDLIVESDSVINSKVFYKFSSSQTYFFGFWGTDDYLFRYDSLEQKLWIKFPDDDTVRLAVDFNTPAGSIFTSYIFGYPVTFTSSGIFIDTVFNFVVPAFKMDYVGYSDERSYEFADNFGIVDYYYFHAEGTDYDINFDSLYSAIIDSTVYNPLYLEITDLAPLNDRPIDTFPFVLSGYYQASIPELIDSFYVDIIHTRADSVLHSWKIEFEGHQVNVPIYSGMLQVGDIIKVRATIKDESIFNNVDYYPDSGYVLIHVLDPVTGLEENKNPEEFSLQQNYPNPFNPSTVIEYSLGEPGRVTLKVYNLLGVEVASLINEEQPAGEHRFLFDADKYNLPSGVYFYKFTAGEFVDVKKMILTR